MKSFSLQLILIILLGHSMCAAATDRVAQLRARRQIAINLLAQINWAAKKGYDYKQLLKRYSEFVEPELSNTVETLKQLHIDTNKEGTVVLASEFVDDRITKKVQRELVTVVGWVENGQVVLAKGKDGVTSAWPADQIAWPENFEPGFYLNIVNKREYKLEGTMFKCPVEHVLVLKDDDRPLVISGFSEFQQIFVRPLPSQALPLIGRKVAVYLVSAYKERVYSTVLRAYPGDLFAIQFSRYVRSKTEIEQTLIRPSEEEFPAVYYPFRWLNALGIFGIPIRVRGTLPNGDIVTTEHKILPGSQVLFGNGHRAFTQRCRALLMSQN